MGDSKGDLLDHDVIEGIMNLGSVEGETGDMGVDGESYGFILHGVCPSMIVYVVT